MKVLNKFAIAGAVALAMAVPATANAASFTLASYTVSAFNETNNNGLDIDVTNLMAFNTVFALNAVGDSFQANLFRIGTEEQSIENDDETNRAISVAFSFSQPSPGFGGSVFGTTDGFVQFFTDCGFFAGGCGRVNWTSSTLMAFNGGVLRITLEDDVFATPGDANIMARFTLERLDPTAVPEPASMLLIGTGLAGLAARARRRRKA